eukprot:1477216-Alexandrium_andersonii.AAC.1
MLTSVNLALSPTPTWLLPSRLGPAPGTWSSPARASPRVSPGQGLARSPRRPASAPVATSRRAGMEI